MGDANAAGLGFLEAVNRGIGIENARKYTVNPLVYLDRVGNRKSVPANPAQPVPRSEGVATKPQEPQRNNVANAGVESVSFAGSKQSAPFSDVPPTHPYADAISFVKSKGIANGSAGLFRPNDAVTRSEILKMAFVAAGKSPSSDLSSYFSDVPA